LFELLGVLFNLLMQVCLVDSNGQQISQCP
jgi:hypothetical protein